MLEQELKKYKIQTECHWGDPFYKNHDISTGYSLTNDTWIYAGSRSKSIGLLLEFTNSDELSYSPFCLTIYTSGRVVNSSRKISVSMENYLETFMGTQMVSKLNGKLNGLGRIILFDELLFLVERGSLLLFTWSCSRIEWVQMPIIYLFDILIRRHSLIFNLSSYLSYSNSRRSGLMIQSNIDNFPIEIHRAQLYREHNPNYFNIDNYNSSNTCSDYLCNSKSNKPNFGCYYTAIFKKRNKTIRNSEQLVSKQMHDYCLFNRHFLSKGIDLFISVISINSEVGLKVSISDL
ncbi:hypothetical protein HWI79_3007 [Cryptosporidium felis]|nr:hypothetical protein HWI79_3007 [Cryptosporidium felis]